MKITISDDSIGRKIASRRKELNMTQPDLAEAIGISTNSVNRLERGHRSPTLEEITKIGEILQVGLFTLVSGKTDTAPGKPSLVPVFEARDITGSFIPKDRVRAQMVLPEYEDADFIIRMSGDSMAPRIGDGELLVVKCQKTDIGELSAFIDQYGGFHVGWKREVDSRDAYVPENRQYPLIEGDSAKLIGKVVASVKVTSFK